MKRNPFLIENETASSRTTLLQSDEPFKSEWKLDSQKNKLTFLLLGTGMLLPWNAILAAMSFFVQEFPEQKPDFALLVAVSAPMLVVQALSFFLLQWIPLQVKMTVTFALNTVCTLLLVLVPLLVEDKDVAYPIVLWVAAMFGSSYAVLQSTLYGVAGPSAALTNNLMLGLGISGLAVNLLRMLFLATITNVNTSSQIFFYASTAFLLICTALSYSFVANYSLHTPSYSYVTMKDRGASAWKVYKENWKEAIGVVLTFGVQFSFFPGVTFKYQFISNFDWFVIVVVTYASLLDLAGRYTASWKDFLPKRWYIWLCLARVAVFTTTYLLTYEGVKPEFFGADWFVVLNLGLFAFTCGLWATAGMKYGSEATKGDQGLAGSIMGLHLTFGICLGSSIAILFLS